MKRFAIIVALATVSFAQVQNSEGERVRTFLGLGLPPDRIAAERGKRLFASNCAFCHGMKATGAQGPDLVRSALVLHDEKGELIGPVVLKGRPEKGMPAFSFSDSQVYDIAQFLHSRVEETANRGLYQVQNVITGDVKAGQAYFNGPGRCNNCHSPTGDLAHIASKYQPAELQLAFLYPPSVTSFDQGLKRSTGSEVTITLPSGESLTGVLKHLDDFNVSMYDSSGAYHSWPRGQVKLNIQDPLATHRELLRQYGDTDIHNLLAYLVTLK